MHPLDQNPSDADIAKMIKAVENGNGFIDFAEFLSMMANIGVDDGGQLLIDEFRIFDKNGDGLINVMELKCVMSRLGEKLTDEQIDEMIKEAEIDGDGCIDYKEFVQVMTT
ncbi:hypothetical protein PILCRDRAFT_822264, partial [Piloderma croceum F 1598]